MLQSEPQPSGSGWPDREGTAGGTPALPPSRSLPGQTRRAGLRTLLTPSLFRPSVAAARLAAVSRPAFAAVFVLSLLCYAGVLIGLVLWSQTVTTVWLPPPTTSPTTATATDPAYWAGLITEVRERTVADIWQEWHAHALYGWFGPAEITLALVVVLGPLLVLLLAWLNLPLIHGTGSVWGSFRRSVRAAMTILWPLAVLTFVSGYVAITAAHSDFRTGRSFALHPLNDPDFLLFLCRSISACCLILWLRRAAVGVAPAGPEAPPAPRCEGCGYNLTHRPEDGRCPECGLPVEASLDESRSRPGSLWSRTRSVTSWPETACQVLFRPTRFYRTLKMRTPIIAEARFAGWNYVLLYCSALLWVSTVSVFDVNIRHDPVWLRITLLIDLAMMGALATLRLALGRPRGWALAALASLCWAAAQVACLTLAMSWRLAGGCREVLLDLAPAGVTVLVAVAACWLGHRVLAAVTFSVWLLQRELPDFRWAAKVIVYETAFLWVFGVFWGVLVTSFYFAGPWISSLLGRQAWPVFGPPVEVYVVMLGTIGLAAVWFLRYRIAYRAIRWSNF